MRSPDRLTALRREAFSKVCTIRAWTRRGSRSAHWPPPRKETALAASLTKSRGKILYQIEKTRKKTERETLRRDARASEESRYLGAMLYPHRHMQERFYSILPFLAQHGLDLPDRLYEVVQVDCPDHRVVTL